MRRRRIRVRARHRSLWIWSAAVGAALLPGMVAGQAPVVGEAGERTARPEAAEAARLFLGALVRESNLPGLQVAVWRDGTVVWSHAFGFADLEHRTPMTSDTRLRIGSLSKALTAAAALRLHEAGRLDLDAPVRRYVPSFPAKGWEPTPRQLALHLGGIRHYHDDETQLRYRRYETATEALPLFADDPLLHEPGTAYEYSSYGYNLLGAVIEGASALSYPEYVRREILSPLGLDRTIAEYSDSVVPGRAGFYTESDADGRLLNAVFTDNSYKWPSGGWLSTAEEMARFAGALAEGRVVGHELLPTAFASGVTAGGDTTGYAMGWRPREDARGRRVMRHGGSSVGGRAFLLLYPDDDAAAAILVNASRAPVFQEELEPLLHFFLDHGAGDTIVAEAPELRGAWRFSSLRGDDTITGTLYLSGDGDRPGSMDWQGASQPVPLAVVDRHGEDLLIVGAGVHGALTLRATRRGDRLDGTWNWLGRTSEFSATCTCEDPR